MRFIRLARTAETRFKRCSTQDLPRVENEQIILLRKKKLKKRILIH